jgi:sporulation protein YlmC with PRC-barrel domain
MTTQADLTLSKLTGTGMTVKNAVDDMRGRKVTDKDGKDVGKVHDVFVDHREHKARFLLIEHGGFLGIDERKSVIPVDAITRTTATTSTSTTLATTSPRHPAITQTWSTTAATRTASTTTRAARPTGQPATLTRASTSNTRCDGPGRSVSRQLGYGQQDRGIFQRLQAVTSVGNL